MKKTKILSLLLCLSLLCALLVPGPAAHADAAGSGMNISKTATRNDDGSYTITLEAFATGSKVTTVVKEDVPTDIILVLDQSGSMDDDIGTVTFEEYTDDYYYGRTDYHTRNRDYYEYRHNGGSANLWYKLEDDSYVSVSVTKTQEYKQLSTNLPNYSEYYECYWDYANNLYEKVGDEYKQVDLTYTEKNYRYTFTYTFSDGSSVSSQGLGSTPDLGAHAPLYTPAADGTSTVYTYTYTDASGVTQTIGTSTGADTAYTPAFYKKVTVASGTKKVTALKSAVNGFVSAVAQKAAGADGDIATTADNINHRIAVVGFASQSGYGNNTELLSISGRNSGSVGVAYNNITNQNLKDVVQSMDTSAGQTMVTNAINALATNGATRTDLGLDMAERILRANPVGANEKRNRVVIVFTDGSPTAESGFQKGVATSAITNSDNIKNLGATVYSIGIFSGADATSAGTEPGGNLDEGNSQIPAACNWFMQRVSSNNGIPQSPSYYLSASDAGSLSSIFQQISSNIESGGSSTTLDEKSEIRDIIAPAFSVPADASAVKLYTAASNGSTTNWKERVDFDGTVKIENDTVTATGFSFKDNWCGSETNNGTTTFHDGKKLIIEFTVRLKDGFLGGNDVYTNGEAGVYENAEAKTPLMEFEKPTVNVPIQNVSVTATDKNVYLLGNVTADQLKSGATVAVGNVSLDLSKANDADKPYGLEPWQTEYVDIAVEVTAVGSITDMTEDASYTVEVTVKPKTETPTSKEGTAATKQEGQANANINVFKPALTFKDSDVYYGESVPANNDYSGNKVGNEKWMHGTTDSTTVNMLGDKPTLGITYTPDAAKLDDGKYTKQDVPVTAAVSISGRDVTSYTTFEHQACTSDCGWTTPATPGAPAFLLHVKTCTLNITKAGGASDESYVFDVYKDGTKYSEVTVWGNGTEILVELPVGTYTITENTGWSWRYNADNGSAANLTAQNPTGTITCTNTQKNDQWLNGFSAIVRNIFGQKH